MNYCKKTLDCCQKKKGLNNSKSSSLLDLAEKFDTDLKNLQPPEEKHFLNPRLSISTRFLSRFQDRIR